MDIEQIKLVRNEEDRKKKSLGEKLARAAALAFGEQQQLVQLKDYQSDYLNTIQQGEQNWTAQRTSHYRDFCYQLNKVISEQELKLEKTKQNVDELRRQVGLIQQKINLMDEMIEREMAQELVVQNRAQQKEVDALVARQYYA